MCKFGCRRISHAYHSVGTCRRYKSRKLEKDKEDRYPRKRCLWAISTNETSVSRYRRDLPRKQGTKKIVSSKDPWSVSIKGSQKKCDVAQETTQGSAGYNHTTVGNTEAFKRKKWETLQGMWSDWGQSPHGSCQCTAKSWLTEFILVF
jgi:hypothetical protein